MKRAYFAAPLVLFAVTAAAQFPPAKPIPTPTDPGAIVLNAAAQPGVPEQWEDLGRTRTARNVTTSTLTPFLPDPAKATGAAVIVAPGGAFLMLSMDNEGYAVAHWLADHGIAAFVLKYRVKPTDPDPKAYMAQVMAVLRDIPAGGKVDISAPPPAVEDARSAVRLVRSRASEWKIDPARVGFAGFSAGAMLTLTIGLDPDASVRPDFIAPIYGPMGDHAIPAYAPPMFNALAADDPLFGKAGFDLISAWHKAGRPVEFHFYEKGGHGFGMMHQNFTSDIWIDEFYAWMKDRGLLDKAAK